MPEIISLVLDSLPASLVKVSPASPHQLAAMLILRAGCARMAGVHSKVWIFAIKAELTSLALSNILSLQRGGCVSHLVVPIPNRSILTQAS